ncbi:MAG TPA: HAD family phosphatase [Candidatus Omnitrophota bacterium]|nr:HAD family phosphatase [Candidatus Omnitrophota bacterium]HPB67849.1 HAD family phosphatase [Candidatus Omnitrophota bacterium]HQO58150.1 HAD family phosphatase [Candidatus Omnitrophota bacterium]
MKSFCVDVQAVLFDMDGVITNTMPDHYRAWHQVLLQEEGIAVPREEIYRREGQKGSVSVRELLSLYHGKYTPAKSRRLLLAKEALFKKIVKQRFIVGARTFLRDMQRRGMLLALVTGTSRHEMHRILPDKVLRHFTVTVTGNDVRRGKPDPEPYLKALKLLHVNASRALVIENAPFGVQAAKAAGVTCFAIATSLPPCYLKRADRIFVSFKDMREKVLFLNNLPAHQKRLRRK